MSAHDHLGDQFQSFWHEPSDPDTGYHVAPTEARSSIEHYGLRPGKAYSSIDQPGGVYMHHSLHGVTSYGQQGDIYKVDTRGLALHPDRMMEQHEGQDASFVPHPVARKRITRIGQRTDKGIVLDPEHSRTPTEHQPDWAQNWGK